MTHDEKIVRHLMQLSNEIYRLKQNQLEIQKEIIRMRLESRLAEWKKDGLSAISGHQDKPMRKLHFH